MNTKEHLQFLILMIPTLLLLVAAALSLAAPAGSVVEPRAAEQTVADPQGRHELVEVDTDIGPMLTLLVR